MTGGNNNVGAKGGSPMNVELLLQLIINGLIIGTLYGVVAMCFVLIYKASQIVNFAQGEFLLIGAWVCWWFLTEFQLPFYAGFLLTLVFMMVFGILLQVLVLRPLIGEPIISVIMVTIGLSIFFQAIINWMFGVFVQPFPPIFETKAVDVLGLNVQPAYLMSLVISVFIMAGFAWFFKYSRLGLAMRATAFDQQVAQSLGISIKQMFAMSWAISAMVSALAGVVVGIVSGVSSALSFFGIKVFPAVILGGLDSIVGAVVGGLIIGVLENLAEFVDGQWLHLGNLYSVAPFYVLVIILMIKPYGLFGTEEIERV
jgi:branched-chain amino acid transport system permease protein